MLNKNIRHHLINVAVAALWGFYAYNHFHQATATDQIKTGHLLFFLRNTLLTLLFLIRRPPKETSTNAKEWVVAVYGLFVGYFYSPQGTVSLVPPSSLIFAKYIIGSTA